MTTPPMSSWECFSDRSYFDMWCVREVGERDFRRSFHLVNGVEAQGLCDLLNSMTTATPTSNIKDNPA